MYNNVVSSLVKEWNRGTAETRRRSLIGRRCADDWGIVLECLLVWIITQIGDITVITDA